jgi:hypothetical protein
MTVLERSAADRTLSTNSGSSAFGRFKVSQTASQSAGAPRGAFASSIREVAGFAGISPETLDTLSASADNVIEPDRRKAILTPSAPAAGVHNTDVS